jgi:anti-anti-sigma regulatory factor
MCPTCEWQRDEREEGPADGGDRAWTMTAHRIPAAMAGARFGARLGSGPRLDTGSPPSWPATPPDTAIAISRLEDRVLVAVHGEVTQDLAAVLRHAVIDLVDGQGNLSIALDLPEGAALDDAVLSLLLETAERLEEQDGALLVRTADGTWVPPSRTRGAAADTRR